ncbi:MAG: alpha/beta hydrolase [Dehalococcoidia bacterium]|nr:alpha/beta hydrolase [Dehalococcoidia bacterium]
MNEAQEIVRDEFVQLNGLRLHYRDWLSTTPDAPILLLIHGFTHHSRTWDSFALAMRDRFRVLALDMRGHGESQWAPRDQYSPLYLADDIEAFVKALGLRQFAVLGLSLGGRAAYTYASRRPPELSRLVIVDIAPLTAPAGSARVISTVTGAYEFPSSEDAISLAQSLAPNQLPDEVRHRIENNLVRLADGRSAYRYDRAFHEDPAVVAVPQEHGWESLARITVPTLLIRGADSDVLTPELASRIVETVPGCQFVRITGAGHVVHHERPDEFAEAVRAFL